MRWLFLPVMLVCATACQTQAPRDGTAIHAMRDALEEANADARTRAVAPPPEVAASLMPPMNIQLGGVSPAEAEHRFGGVGDDAAAGKDPGFTPLSLLELLRRRGKVRPEEINRLHLARPVDLQQLKADWLEALDQAEAQRIAIMAQTGLARALRPIHSPLDGDAVFVRTMRTRIVRRSTSCRMPVSPLMSNTSRRHSRYVSNMIGKSP